MLGYSKLDEEQNQSKLRKKINKSNDEFDDSTESRNIKFV